jgi:hypothetical protein
MGYRIAALVVAMGVVTCAALAAATPVTPPPGAVLTTSQPVFNWTLPANERSDALYIANKPDTTPAGKFLDENVVRSRSFTKDETTWSPSSPLYAGRYWWLVSSRDRNASQSYYSVPREFRIEVSLVMYAVKTRRFLSRHRLGVTVRWRANVRTMTVKASLLRRGRIIWARTERKKNRLGSLNSVTFTWHRPHRIRQGTLLTLRAGIVASDRGGAAGTFFKVRAP